MFFVHFISLTLNDFRWILLIASMHRQQQQQQRQLQQQQQQLGLLIVRNRN